MSSVLSKEVRAAIERGTAIPANPLALTEKRQFDERRQRALCRYYADAGAGGLAVGVHTTQFRIHDPKVGLLKPVLELAVEEMKKSDAKNGTRLVRVAGICGRTAQAAAEARLASELGYDVGLLSLAAMKDADEDETIAHAREISGQIPIAGFYLQPSVGGRVLPYSFWRKFAEIENVALIKIAPFNRYQSIDVVRAIVAAGRSDIALYTGNDDNIVMDLLTPYRFKVGGEYVERRIVGGLLGHWSVWTKKAVELLETCRAAVAAGGPVDPAILRLSIEVTDSNAAFFDVANAFAGCVPGLHEVLRRQGLLAGIWCLDPNEVLGPGQAAEIDRVYAAYPQLNDDDFIAERLDGWLA